MLYLILIIFCVFMIFFLGDLILTLKTIRKAKTAKIELNPLMRIRSHFVYVFKTIELLIFLYLIYVLTKINGATSFYILLSFIFFYSLLVANNAHVYYKVTGKESGTFKIIFIISVISMLSFIYLNYILYEDLKISYDALTQSYEGYNKLYHQCVEKNISGDMIVPQELGEILREFNMTIERVVL